MNNLDKMFSETKTATQYASRYLNYLGDLLKSFDPSAIGEMAEEFLSAREEGRTIYFKE